MTTHKAQHTTGPGYRVQPLAGTKFTHIVNPDGLIEATVHETEAQGVLAVYESRNALLAALEALLIEGPKVAATHPESVDRLSYAVAKNLARAAIEQAKGE